MHYTIIIAIYLWLKSDIRAHLHTYPLYTDSTAHLETRDEAESDLYRSAANIRSYYPNFLFF